MALIKTCTFAITHLAVAFSVVYAMTGDIVIGGTVALIEPACNTVSFFAHEKLWTRVQNRHRPATLGA